MGLVGHFSAAAYSGMAIGTLCAWGDAGRTERHQHGHGAPQQGLDRLMIPFGRETAPSTKSELNRLLPSPVYAPEFLSPRRGGPHPPPSNVDGVTADPVKRPRRRLGTGGGWKPPQGGMNLPNCGLHWRNPAQPDNKRDNGDQRKRGGVVSDLQLHPARFPTGTPGG